MTNRPKRGEIKPRERPPFPMPPASVPVSPTASSAPVRLMSKTEVMALLPIKSPVSLWSWVKQGRFPAPRQIGPEGSRRSTIGWLDREVYEALANLPKRLPKGSKVQP